MQRVRDWIIEEGLDLEAKKHGATHTSMMNGRAHIPFAMLPAFFAVLKKEIDDCGPAAWCELITAVFNLFFDIDIVFINKPRGDEGFEIAKEIQSVVMQCTQSPFTVHVFERFPTEVLVDGFKRYKYGIHMVWEGLAIRSAQALVIRERVVTHLMSELNVERGENNWEARIDRKVLTSSGGLRMPNNIKGEICPKCHDGDNRDSCWKCNRNGRVPVGRPYLYKFSLDGKGELVDDGQLRYDIVEQFKRCSIRSVANPVPLTLDPREVVVEHKGASKWERVFGGEDPIADAFKEIVNSWDRDFWKNLVIDKFSKMGSNFSVAVRGEGNKYCLTRGRKHGQSTIYFIIRKDGTIDQTCWSAHCKKACVTVGLVTRPILNALKGEEVNFNTRKRKRGDAYKSSDVL